MNAVEIEAAVSDLASAPYDASEFPFQFLAAFDKKETTLKRLRKGDTNKSDVPGAVLLTNSIHLATGPAGQTRETLDRLKASPKTASARAKFIFATDGTFFEAEALTGGQETVADDLAKLANHFGFFLPLAGISTVREIKDNPIDIRATGRLNKLYIALLQLNPEWSTEARRHDMNHFMARLIFCFFAEHTDIFNGTRLFTDTIEQMSEGDGTNTHEVLGEIFRAMNVKPGERIARGLRPFADQFPYVNGGLFADSTETPRFNRIARSYLLQAGKLEWQHINPDIFGSMIQAVADDEERGALGMHYTSVPNILKVLNPLFLDDLRAQLEAAGNNGRMLLNLRQRMGRIRVFDPACGSGNFLVIAYKQMRSIEAEINRRRGEDMLPTNISEKNFRGIELRDFAAEIARLALVIAKYQCDVQHRGPLAAKAEFLPLKDDNWITRGNALQLDWLKLCPPVGTAVKLHSDDLFQTPLDQPVIDFENAGGETYICGNPPFTGTRKQSEEQKQDLHIVFSDFTSKWKNVDYVGAWLMKAALYNRSCPTRFAFVATNSLCQGQQVPITWAALKILGCLIRFAHHPFKWENLARNRAGVTVVVVGVDSNPSGPRILFTADSQRVVSYINPYLTDHQIEIIEASKKPLFTNQRMDYGVYYSKSAGLLLDSKERQELLEEGFPSRFVKLFLGSNEFIHGTLRYCLWVSDESLDQASEFKTFKTRVASVRKDRLATEDAYVNKLANRPHEFRERKGDEQQKLFIPIVSSESREYFPVGVVDESVIPTNKAFFMANTPLWCLSIIASKLHLSWIAAICGRLEMRFSYSNTLGWNTFPMPSLTEQNKADLTRCAEDILLARETHFPKTIADLYNPDKMPPNLRAAHESNDEAIERIYIGRRFRNDTERLEKLFDMYTKMIANSAISKKPAVKRERKVTV